MTAHVGTIENLLLRSPLDRIRCNTVGTLLPLTLTLAGVLLVAGCFGGGRSIDQPEPPEPTGDYLQFAGQGCRVGLVETRTPRPERSVHGQVARSASRPEPLPIRDTPGC